MGLITQNPTIWDFNKAKNLAETNLSDAPTADKGDVFILALNQGTARFIVDAYAADTDLTSYIVTVQSAEIASLHHIIGSNQSVTILKDVRMQVDNASAMAISADTDATVVATGECDNGLTIVPAKQSELIMVN